MTLEKRVQRFSESTGVGKRQEGISRYGMVLAKRTLKAEITGSNPVCATTGKQ